MKLFMTYAVQHTLGSQILVKISSQDRFRSWLEKTEVSTVHSSHYADGGIQVLGCVWVGVVGINCVCFTVRFYIITM